MKPQHLPQVAALKIHFDILDENIGYRSLKIFDYTSFGELHTRVCEKVGITAQRGVFFRIVIRYNSPVALPRVDCVPHPDCKVIERIEYEETTWPGEIMLVFADVRKKDSRTNEISAVSSSLRRQLGSKEDVNSVPIPMTEFLVFPDGFERFSTLADDLLSEIENISIKSGRLLKAQRGTDHIWREVSVFLDQTRLWFSKGLEGDRSVSFLELSSDGAFRVVDEASGTFLVKTSDGSWTPFRAKSKAVMNQWTAAIEGRSDFVSENNMIAMADEHISAHEYDRVEDNFSSLSAIGDFRGTLCNRYLREKFRKYLERSDEDALLKFWEYAEDYKLCHVKSHRFDEQHDLREASGSARKRHQQIWPSEYKCSIHESKKFAAFIYQAFLTPGAKYFIKSFQPEQLNAVSESLQKAPRTLFVPLQQLAMKSLKLLFYSDFARAYKYREYLIDASMDVLGVQESEYALHCNMFSTASVTQSIASPSPPPKTSEKKRTNSFTLPFSMRKSKSEVESIDSSTATTVVVRKAFSLDTKPSHLSEATPGTPATKKDGIAFSTPTAEPQASPMSFVFTPSPEAKTPRGEIVPAAQKGSITPAPDLPKRNGWFSNFRIFGSPSTSNPSEEVPAPQLKSTPKGKSNKSLNLSPATHEALIPEGYDPYEDENAIYRHPSWRDDFTYDGKSSLIWLNEEWWRGKAPTMDGCLSSLEASVSSQLDEGGAESFSARETKYSYYAAWAPGHHTEDILKKVRENNFEMSALEQHLTPLPDGGSSFTFGSFETMSISPSRAGDRSYLSECFAESTTAVENPVEDITSPKKQLIVWHNSYVPKVDRHHRHRDPKNYRRRSNAGAKFFLPKSSEFVIEDANLAKLNVVRDGNPPNAPPNPLKPSDKNKVDNQHRESLLPVGVFHSRIGKLSGRMSVLGGALSKVISCGNNNHIFSARCKLMYYGNPVPWSISSTKRLNVSVNALSSNSHTIEFLSPSRSDRGTTVGSQLEANRFSSFESRGAKGPNIFMNRKAEVNARLGELSRKSELQAGRLKGEAVGLLVGAAHPYPPYFGGFRGQILIWSYMRARYVRHLTGSPGGNAGSVSGAASVISMSSYSNASRVSISSKVGASPRHLNSSKGIADLTVSSMSFPPHAIPENEPFTPNQSFHPKLLQEGEIENCNEYRYSAVLLLCPDNSCQILLYSVVDSSLNSSNEGSFESQQLRAIINLRKATSLVPSSFNSFNISDESGLVWNMLPEGIDEDDSRIACKRWLDTIFENSIADKKLATKIVRIVHHGYLAKRGLVNTSFRRRWFILDSKHQLRYYKEESGHEKGKISISEVLKIESRGKEISLHTEKRLWQLQADSEDDAVLWEAAMKAMLSSLSVVGGRRQDKANTSNLCADDISNETVYMDDT